MNNIYESHPARILDIKKHTDVDWSFILDAQVPEAPGQFIMMSLPEVGEAPVTISGFTSSTMEITVRNVGRVTSQLFQLKIGECLHFRGPYGNLFPLDIFENKHLLLIAGGSGMAAVKSLVEYYVREPHQLREMDLLVGYKSPQHILYKKELQHWERDCGVVVTVDKHENEEESWAGGIGFVVDYVKHVKDIGPKTQVVLVGPPIMMTNTVKELLQHKVLEENIWLSFERHMKCGVGKCGHCRIRDKYVCIDGPVFSYVEAKQLID